MGTQYLLPKVILYIDKKVLILTGNWMSNVKNEMFINEISNLISICNHMFPNNTFYVKIDLNLISSDGMNKLLNMISKHLNSDIIFHWHIHDKDLKYELMNHVSMSHKLLLLESKLNLLIDE